MLYVNVITTSLSAEEALDLMDKFENDWLYPNWDRWKGELCVDVEFQ